MTNIIDKAYHKATGTRWAAASPVTLQLTDNLCNQPTPDPYLDEYQLEVRIAVRYRCRIADRKYAARNAEKLLLQSLYTESLGDIAMLRSFIYGGQQAEALSLLDKIQEDMGL